jgi:hypothetical protein
MLTTLPFSRGWSDVLSCLQIHLVTWEEVLAGLHYRELNHFYDLYKRFNG